MRRIAEKVATIKGDLGTVNPLIDAEVKGHFISGQTASEPAPTAPVPALTALAGELSLNQSLTKLTATYDDRRAKLHLTPYNARRVIETALAVSREPALEEALEGREAGEAFSVSRLGARWQPALAGLDTRLAPGVYRPITFDEKVSRKDPGVVHIHLGHALMQKSARLLRSGLLGAGSDMHRVTAVVDESIPESSVAAVSRLVLVGRGGLRLHEEVFMTGIRLHGNAMAEDKVNDLLDRVLDRHGMTLAAGSVRTRLAETWNAERSRMRGRLQAAMDTRAEKRQKAVEGSLQNRCETELSRASEIYRKFRENLHQSLAQLRSEHDEQLAMLFSDDQQNQRRRDIRAMEIRLDMLEEEEVKELAGIRSRYEDVQPYITAAAVVFALTPADAATFGEDR